MSRTRPYGWNDRREDEAHRWLNEMEAAAIRGNRTLVRDWGDRVREMIERHGNFEGHSVRERWLRILDLDRSIAKRRALDEAQVSDTIP